LRRDTYQFGWVEKQKRSRGPAVWVWRFRQKQSDGRDKKLSVLLGTAQEIKSEAEAWRKAEAHRIHADSKRTPEGRVSFGALCDRYIAEAAPTRHSTRKSYMTILNKHVMPKWENVRISQVRPMYVQEWLMNLNLTATTKGKIKALMHRLFERAMFWELIPTERNPMGLVEIPGSSRRSKKPIILTVDQYFAILQLLIEPYRTMVVVAQCLGLRVSEILALQWPDINFAELTMRVSRAVVDGFVDEVKTEYSEDDLPLDPDLATVLFNWKNQCPESDEHWVFPSPITGRCYHASPIQQDYIRPAGRKLGLGDIGWHTFRHTYRSWLDSVGTPIGVQQKLMRHAQIATTMNVYGNSMMESKREANSKVVQMALKQESNGGNGNGHSEQKLARRDQLPLSAPASETSNARNPMKSLVAGGGFEPPTFGL
jgi:integrase